MDTTINDFCQRYSLKLRNDRDISKVKLESSKDDRERISFHLVETFSSPSTYRFTYMSHGRKLFTLDEEDLRYLYEKYSKKLQDEMNKNIEQVKQMYKDIDETNK